MISAGIKAESLYMMRIQPIYRIFDHQRLLTVCANSYLDSIPCYWLG